MLSACFHIHTKYSHDSKIEPRDIVKFAKKLRINILGITDHNTARGALEVKKMARESEILVLIGQEIKTDCGDMIILGTSEKLERNLFDLLDKAKREKLFTFLPHPFDFFRKSSSIGMNLSEDELKLAAEKTDAVEVFNSRCFLNQFNQKAEKFSKSNRIPGLAGTDAHVLNELGNAINYMDCEKSEKEVYKAIKSGKVSWRCRKTSVFNYLRRYF